MPEDAAKVIVELLQEILLSLEKTRAAVEKLAEGR